MGRGQQSNRNSCSPSSGSQKSGIKVSTCSFLSSRWPWTVAGVVSSGPGLCLHLQAAVFPVRPGPDFPSLPKTPVPAWIRAHPDPLRPRLGPIFTPRRPCFLTRSHLGGGGGALALVAVMAPPPPCPGVPAGSRWAAAGLPPSGEPGRACRSPDRAAGREPRASSASPRATKLHAPLTCVDGAAARSEVCVPSVTGGWGGAGRASRRWVSLSSQLSPS